MGPTKSCGFHVNINQSKRVCRKVCVSMCVTSILYMLELRFETQSLHLLRGKFLTSSYLTKKKRVLVFFNLLNNVIK